MIYILIVWSALCTAGAMTCATGDYTVVARDLALSECNDRLRAWNAIADDHRGACYTTRTRR